MVIRIRVRTRQNLTELQAQFALALSALLTPSALVAFTICFWSFAAELGLLSDSYVGTGIFSHRRIWFVAAVALLVAAKLLAGYGTATAELMAVENSNFHSPNSYFAENSRSFHASR
jgi:hypothetical protein